MRLSEYLVMSGSQSSVAEYRPFAKALQTAFYPTLISLLAKDKAATKFTCAHLEIRFIHTIGVPFVKQQELSLKTPRHNGFV